MCSPSCQGFLRAVLTADLVRGRRVLEVGARDVNAGTTAYLQAVGPPQQRLGVDIGPGVGVDEVCACEGLLGRFGAASWDVVIATELLEHVGDWRACVANLVGVLVPGGDLVITTRSRGYGYHPFPVDNWRYEPADLAAIFRRLDVVRLERDPDAPGVFAHVRRPADLHPAWEAELALVDLHRMPESVA
jgi:SAM-dependent methyltransferase